MGQAKRRGTLEQRRQKAIARDNPTLGPSSLNELYKRQKSQNNSNINRGMSGAVGIGHFWTHFAKNKS